MIPKDTWIALNKAVAMQTVHRRDHQHGDCQKHAHPVAVIVIHVQSHMKVEQLVLYSTHAKQTISPRHSKHKRAFYVLTLPDMFNNKDSLA